MFHLKFGPGSVVSADGPKLTIDFDRAGRRAQNAASAEPLRLCQTLNTAPGRAAGTVRLCPIAAIPRAFNSTTGRS